MIRTVHRAKFTLADSGLLLQNMGVHVSQKVGVHVSEAGHISRITSGTEIQDPGCRVIDWGCAVILPGLVNAHAHLELSSLHRRLTSFSSFTDWLSQLIEIRKSWTPQDYFQSARDGALQSLRCGTTLIGDISGNGSGRRALESQAIRKVIFDEVLSLSTGRAAEIMAGVRDRQAGAPIDALVLPGISPHAPYTVSPALFRAAAYMAKERGLPLAIHAAETVAELMFLEDGTGEFREFLERLGALPADWTPPGLKPIAYLENLGVLSQPTALIHCNYLDPESLDMIRSTRSSVIYCPRSSAFFGHENHPVRDLLSLGVNVALGTDSLASNDSLSILDEMRFLSRRRKDLTPEEIFRMATQNGAAALGLGGRVGKLEPGYLADMTILELPESIAPRDVIPSILEGAGECIGTIVGGNVAWSRDGQV